MMSLALLTSDAPISGTRIAVATSPITGNPYLANAPLTSTTGSLQAPSTWMKKLTIGKSVSYRILLTNCNNQHCLPDHILNRDWYMVGAQFLEGIFSSSSQATLASR